MADEQTDGQNGQQLGEGKRQISINGRLWVVSAPYKAGHSCNENEAYVLNQTRAENIGNNFRADIKAAMEKAEAGDATDLANLEEEFAKYDAEYQFGIGGIRAPADPYEREARAIARAAIKAQLAEEGRKISDVDQAKLESAIAATALQEDVMALARERVEAQKRARSVTVVGPDLGLGLQS